MTTQDAEDEAGGEAEGGAGRARAQEALNLEAIMQIPVAVKVVLGSTTVSVASLAKLGRGAVIALDRKVGEPVDVTVNGRLVARGEVVVLEDDNSRFGISLTEVVGLPSTLEQKGWKAPQ